MTIVRAKVYGSSEHAARAVGFGLALLALSACSTAIAPPAVSGPPRAAEPSAASVPEGSSEPELAAVTAAPWAASYNLQIAVNRAGQAPQTLTTGHRDWKPAWSPSGSLLTFFRTLHESSNAGSSPDFTQWKTKLCVISADGSGFRELTSGVYSDFNPTWTRDGKNQIIFNRYGVASADSNEIYVISPSGPVGSEARLSNPEYRYEWADSALKDGRIFIDRTNFRAAGGPTMQSFLLRPRAGAVGEYVEIRRPDPRLWQKLSVSPSETKVAYMLDGNGDPASFNDDVLYFADFDPAAGVVSHPKSFTKYDPSCVNEYPRWSPDEALIIYDSSCFGHNQMFAYRIADSATVRITADASAYFMFGDFEGLPP